MTATLATYDPALPTARDRLRHELWDYQFFIDPAAVALDPDITYDALITLYGEGEALYRQAMAFLSRYGTDITLIRDSDGSEIEWRYRVQAWTAIVQNASGVTGAAGAFARASQKPLVGLAKTTAPISPPPGCVVDANDQWYRGSAYPVRGWRGY